MSNQPSRLSGASVDGMFVTSGRQDPLFKSRKPIMCSSVILKACIPVASGSLPQCLTAPALRSSSHGCHLSLISPSPHRTLPVQLSSSLLGFALPAGMPRSSLRAHALCCLRVSHPPNDSLMKANCVDPSAGHSALGSGCWALGESGPQSEPHGGLARSPGEEHGHCQSP